MSKPSIWWLASCCFKISWSVQFQCFLILRYRILESICSFTYHIDFFARNIFKKMMNFLVIDKKCGRNCLSHAAQFSVVNGCINAAEYFMNQAPFHSTFHILVVNKYLHKVHLFWWEFLMEILILIWARSREKKHTFFHKH